MGPDTGTRPGSAPARCSVGQLVAHGRGDEDLDDPVFVVKYKGECFSNVHFLSSLILVLKLYQNLAFLAIILFTWKWRQGCKLPLHAHHGIEQAGIVVQGETIGHTGDIVAHGALHGFFRGSDPGLYRLWQLGRLLGVRLP